MRNLGRVMRLAFVCGALIGACGAAVQAIERRPLPAFTVTGSGGAAVNSADLTQPGKWLFVYVSSGCAPCNTLLRTVDETQQPLVAGRMVIVVGGVNDGDLPAFKAQYPKLTTATWYADATRSAARRLKAPGIPFVFGMKQQITEWAWIGVAPDTASAASALISWAGAAMTQERYSFVRGGW